MLDIDHGTYPFVTSSSASAGGACTGTGVAAHPHSRRDRRLQGVHHARRRRTLSHRSLRPRGRTDPHARQGIRRRDRPSAPLRLVRRPAAALHRHHQRLRQHRGDQARRAGRVRPDSGLRGLSHRRQGSLRHAADGRRDREDRARLRVRARLEHRRPSASRTTTNCRRRPRQYIAFLEARTGVEVGCISTGPERNQTIVRPGSRFEKLVG